MTAAAETAVDPRAWKALAVASGGYVLFGFNSTATNLAFGPIGDSFPGVSESILSWIVSSYFVVAAALLPLGGRLADRVGRRRVFRIGLGVFVVTAIVSAVAPTVWILIGARATQAAAGALIIPSSLAMVLPAFPASRRSSAVATWAAAGPLSAALAPSIAALLLEQTSWRWVYLVSAPLAAIALAASYRFATESRGERDAGRLDGFGTVLAVISLAGLIVAVSRGSDWGWLGGRTVLTVAAAVLGGGLFILRSMRHPTPLLNLSLFRIPEVAIANLANFFMSITSLSIWLVWPLWLGRVWDYSTARIGLAITVGPICAGFASLLGGRLADRYGQRWLMIGGSALTTAAVTWSIVFFREEPDYLLRFLPTIAGFGLGWGVSHPSMNSWAVSKVPESAYGEVNATFNTIRNLAAAVGTAAAVAIVGSADRLDRLAAYDRVNSFFAASVALSCLVLIFGTAFTARRSKLPS